MQIEEVRVWRLCHIFPVDLALSSGGFDRNGAEKKKKFLSLISRSMRCRDVAI